MTEERPGGGGVQIITLPPSEGEVRLDRWFKRHYPGLSLVRLQKLLRRGDIRVDGKRARHNDRLVPGMTVRVPPLQREQEGERPDADGAGAPAPTQADLAQLKAMILYQDKDVLVLNKPAGLAVQGGTGQTRHLDRLLTVLGDSEADRPKLVHRLDKETSGVLILGRTPAATAALTAAFRARGTVRKEYWALTLGRPSPGRGTITLPLSKALRGGEERMVPDPEGGKQAITDYAVADSAGDRAAFVRCRPVTGRTHQIRAHLAAIGAPILGDRRYADREILAQVLEGTSPGLHLHARRLRLPHPAGKGRLDVTAPLPTAMARTFAVYGLEPLVPSDDEDDFDPYQP